jgi:hypothetical protein
MMNEIQQDIDLWEVWIEFDPSHPEYFGTLYVHGEVIIDKKMRSSLTRVASKDDYQLNLQLPVRSASFRCTKEVLYSEPIRNLNQYTSVCIYAGDELIGSFNEIEIMI